MSLTISTTHHLECDICHADGGTTEDFRPKPDDWRVLGNLDLCGTCIGRMTLREFLAYSDEARRVRGMGQPAGK